MLTASCTCQNTDSAVSAGPSRTASGIPTHQDPRAFLNAFDEAHATLWAPVVASLGQPHGSPHPPLEAVPEMSTAAQQPLGGGGEPAAGGGTADDSPFASGPVADSSGHSGSAAASQVWHLPA